MPLGCVAFGFFLCDSALPALQAPGTSRRLMPQTLNRESDSFAELITSNLARFTSGTAEDLDRHIETSLQEIAEFSGVDYAFIIRTAPDLESWSVVYEWCSKGVPSLIERFQNVAMGAWSYNERVLLAGEVLQLNCLDDLPSDADSERKLIESVGFVSTLQVPTRRPGGQIGGCIALSSLSREVNWTDDDIARLRLVGEAIASVMERARVEKELRKNEARFRATFEHAPTGIANLSVGARLLSANQRFCEMLGYPVEELVGGDYLRYVHPKDVDGTRSLFERVVSKHSPIGAIEGRYLRKDGKVVWGRMTLTLLKEEAGQSAVIIAAIEDINARKQAEETFDAVPDLIFVTDQRGRIVRANGATADRMGVAREQLIGRSCDEVLQDESTVGEGGLDRSVELRQSHRFETQSPHLGGDYLVSRTPLFDASGILTGVVYVARDVTDLRRSEAELRLAHRELEQRKALTVAASLDGVWEWNAKSEQVQYSDRFVELLGYETEEVPQCLEFFREILHPEDAASVWSVMDQHLEEGKPCDVSCRLRVKQGDYRWFRMRGQAQRDEHGRAIWMAGSIQDVHREKTAEAELRQALQEVKRLTDRLQAENVYLQQEINLSLGFDEIVGQSLPLRSVLMQVEHVADTDASVLLLGETGTGKELLARAIHERSSRKARPLVKVNLAALPSSLIESELFGHIKGSFTGAIADKVGRFQLADGGTMFLDEIGELDPELQTKLLRVLQEGEFEPIGSGATRRVDVRIVTATNRDLRAAMEQGDFRPDLYYRLAVFPIEVPPLRRRSDDIPLLTWHFVSKKQGRLGKTISRIPESVMRSLVEYDWPGNVRELENVIERAMILSAGPNLTLTETLQRRTDRGEAARKASRTELDRDRIVAALKACRWKVKGDGNAAERLGLKPSTLRYRMKVLGIERPQSSSE